MEAVNRVPKLRSEYGLETLWQLNDAPGHASLGSELDDRHALDLQFGWFCRRVAEKLGMGEPDALALVGHADDGPSRHEGELSFEVDAIKRRHLGKVARRIGRLTAAMRSSRGRGDAWRRGLLGEIAA